ncbi:MAG: exodeoxyribonuclease III [Pseudomonadota bacterium]
MRVISFNANGIRSAEKKGFFKWLARQKADFVCVQETKAQIEQLTLPAFSPKAFHCVYHDAEKRGYSGVAVYARKKPIHVLAGFSSADPAAQGWEEFDREGRYLEYQYKDLSIVSLYAPSGSSGDVRQQAKYRFMDLFMSHLRRIRKSGRKYVICGDWNIAHKEQDIKNWRGNKKNSGFLPEERAWMDVLFDEVGFIDAFRAIEQKPDQYTWWSNRGQAYAKNVGWRIDYHVVTPELGSRVQKTRIYTKQKFSDHAPLIIDYDFDL